jgi:hypothetical protein
LVGKQRIAGVPCLKKEWKERSSGVLTKENGRLPSVSGSDYILMPSRCQ